MKHGDPTPATTPETEYGGFSIKQGGMVVAGGSGPYPAIMVEAAHYAAVYGQDGPVVVRTWKNRPRRNAANANP